MHQSRTAKKFFLINYIHVMNASNAGVINFNKCLNY